MSQQVNSILIVDDNFFEKIALKNLFEQYQFDCDLASSGLEALNMVQARQNSGKQMYKLIMID